MLKPAAPTLITLLTLGLFGAMAAPAPSSAAPRPGATRFMGRTITPAGSQAQQVKLQRMFAERARAAELAASSAHRGSKPRGPVLNAWQTNGTLACTDPGGQIFPVVTTDGAGGAIVAWLDFRNAGLFDVYANRLNSNGDFASGWTGAGTAVAVRDSIALELQIASDGAGGAFVGFTEFFRTSFAYQDIYLQRILGNGTIAGGWPVGGRKLNVGEIDSYILISDGGAGAYVAWLDLNQQGWVLRVDNSGSPVSGWPAGGIPVGPANAADINFTPDASGGFYLAWASSDSVLCTRYAGNGTVASGWTADGTPIAYNGFFADDLSLARLTSGDVMVVWSDFRTFDIDLYAVRMNAAGGFALGWGPNGVPVCTATGSVGESGAVSDGAGGAVITWLDYRVLSGTTLYAQRITGNGALGSGWAVDGVAMCNTTPSKFPEAFVGDGAGGVLAAWYDDPAMTGTNDIYGQYLQGNGTRPAAYPAAGITVCDAPEDQLDVTMATDGAAGAILAWDDDRDLLVPPKVYAARIRNDGTAATASLANAVAEPGLVRLHWFSPDGAAFAASLERGAEDRDFAPLADLRADAAGHIRYEDRDVTPGATYRYRLVVAEAGSRTILGEVTLRIPDALALAIESARPNPTAGPLTLAFMLPSAAAATVELLDVTGRRVQSREVGGAAGRHVLRLDESLVPGMYVVRLTQSGRAVTSRVVVTE